MLAVRVGLVRWTQWTSRVLWVIWCSVTIWL